MDTDLRHAKRTGDPVAELTALTRMPALRGLPPCRHCGRDLSRVDVRCESCQWHGPRRRQRDSGEPWSPWPACTACNGTGRTEWSWRGDAGRLALLAYAGDEAARALGVECVHAVTAVRLAEFNPDRWPLSDWLRGLDRWPGALLAAGTLAGRAVLPKWEADIRNRHHAGLCQKPRKALDAATEHHLCGCELSLGEWYRVGIHQTPNLPPWVVQPFAGAGNQRDECLHAINAAIRETDEPTIRAAICAGLNRWARTGVL